MLKLLLKAGANPDAPSDAGPPLLWACGHGRTEVAEMLLDAGADPNGSSEDGVTALLAAAAAGETEIVKLLLKRGADPNGKIGEDGGSGEGGVKVTPLFVAANEGNKRMVELLVDAGASANAKDEVRAWLASCDHSMQEGRANNFCLKTAVLNGSPSA